MKVRITILVILSAAVALPAFAFLHSGTYRWGYEPGDDRNYPIDYVPDSDPKLFIVNHSSQFRVVSNVHRENVKLFLPLPANNKLYQRVLSWQTVPDPTKIIESKYGYQVAVFDFGPVPEDIAIGVTYHAEVELYRVQVPLSPDYVGALKDIPDDIRKDYTRNGPFYRLDDPYIQNAAKEAVGDETNVYLQVRKIWLYVRNRLYYLGDGRKDTAPRVLQQGHGSCTEYSFAMIALCRANGIPARYISGSVAKAGGAKVASRDHLFHKIVEVYLPRFGWIPMESTAGGRYVNEGTADEQIGRLRPRMLFFQHEMEPGLAPLDPRRNTLTWINRSMRSRVKLAGSVMNVWERVKSRAE